MALSLGATLRVAAAEPAPLLMSGNAKQVMVEPARLPSGTDARLFGAIVVGASFGIYARDIPAGDYVVELGFLETEVTGPDQRLFALEVNGVPLDARLDVWKQAGGAMKPWVLQTSCAHAGGMFGLSFNGLSRAAILSFARVRRADGSVVATGVAVDWKRSDRLKMLDARSQAVHPVRVGETPFFNVDHSPVGAWASFVYGMEASGGLQMGSSPAKDGYLMPHYGVVVAVKKGDDVRVMPFYTRPAGSAPTPKVFSAAEVRHMLGAATDRWQLPDGVSWTHYTPSWSLPEWDGASVEEQRRFALPATWLTFTVDNRTGAQALELAFGVQQPAVRARDWPDFDGFVVADDHALAVRTGEAEPLEADAVRRDFGLEGATAAFRVRVPAGQQKTVTFIVAHHRAGEVARLGGEPLRFAHAGLFRGPGEVIARADALLPEVVARCQAEEQRLAVAGLSAERAFLSAAAIHSYQFNTLFFLGAQSQRPVWVVIEGEYRLLNTLDLVVDHLFYELALHPWTVRNELDVYLEYYSFVDELARPGETTLHPGGLGFFHDMGSGFAFADPSKGQAYTALMTQEELQNWLISAALYWRATQDDKWLARHRETLQRGLTSMLLRDDIDPAKRDGITSYRSVLRGAERRREITTYDAMDHSLQQPTDSLYIAVKSFGTYLVLEPLFRALGEPALAAECSAAAKRTELGLLAHWDPSAKCFPAVFDGQPASRIIPAIEGLVYPFVMGLERAVAADGPHAALIARLKQHMETVLVDGTCLDARTGGWILSNTSNTTWQSKVYLNQFITEKVLGLTDQRVVGRPDAAHYAYQVLGAPAVCWTCQIFTRELTAFGCRHYPRGVTSALWWLPPATFAPDGKRVSSGPSLFEAGARVLFQGDSITDMARGRTADPNHVLGHSYVFLIAARQGASHPEQGVTFLNRGVSGNEAGDLAARWDADVLAHRPDVVSVLIGVNDVGHALRKDQPFSPERYEELYDGLLARTVAALPKVKLVLCEPFIARGTSSGVRYPEWSAATKALQVVVERLARKYHAPVVHLQEMFDAAFERAPVTVWIWDGVHPTAAGHQLIADEWQRTYQNFYGTPPQAH